MGPSSLELINHSYEEVGLIFAGFLASTPILDETAWRLVGELSGSWFRAASRAHETDAGQGEPGAGSADRLHPSVRAMLAAIRSSDPEDVRS